MTTLAAHSTATTAEQGPLFLHRELDAFECLRCGALIEIPAAIYGLPAETYEWLETANRRHGKECPGVKTVHFVTWEQLSGGQA